MSRSALGLACLALSLAVAGCSGLAASEPEPTPPRGGRANDRPRATPTPAPTPAPLTLEDVLGSDGRLTVLLLGSDKRKGVAGERTDAIIVASIDPGTGAVAMASLPRDTVNVPIAPGKVYAGRINSLFGELERQSGKRKVALRKTKQALAYAFDTEIDYYALVDFRGLVRLINGIGGIDVTLKEALVDPTMHIGRNGLRLKAGRRHLDGKTALAFSRSRHSDSDYERSARQQQVIAATAEKVRKRGVAALPSLAQLARKRLVTDMPLRAAPVLLELAGRAKLGNPKSIVLAPSRWARQLPGTYVITPRVLEIQKMFDRVFGPRG